jgi:hypothetical protein
MEEWVRDDFRRSPSSYPHEVSEQVCDNFARVFIL